MIGENALSRVRHVTIQFEASHKTPKSAFNEWSDKIWSLLGAQQLQSVRTEVIEGDDNKDEAGDDEEEDDDDPYYGRRNRGYHPNRVMCGHNTNAWLSFEWNGVPASFKAVTSLSIGNHVLSNDMQWPSSLTSLTATRVANLDVRELPSTCTRLSLYTCCWHPDHDERKHGGRFRYDDEDSDLPLQLWKPLMNVTTQNRIITSMVVVSFHCAIIVPWDQ
jgi:hypothetical protein